MIIRRLLSFTTLVLFAAVLPLNSSSFVSAQTGEDICPNPGTSSYVACVQEVNQKLSACDALGTGTTTWQSCREEIFDDYGFSAGDGPEVDEGLPAGAAVTAIREDPCGENEYATDILGIPVWYKYLDVRKDVYEYDSGDEVEGKCTPRLSESGGGIDPTSALPIGLAVLEAMMVIAGLVAVVMIFWGSFLYLVSQGESDKAAGARKTVINAAIGLVIVIIATRVVSFIATRLTS